MLYFALDESLLDKITPFGVQPARSIAGPTPARPRQSSDSQSVTEHEKFSGLLDGLVFGNIFASLLATWICALIGVLLGMACGALLGAPSGMIIGGCSGLLFGNILCRIAADKADD